MFRLPYRLVRVVQTVRLNLSGSDCPKDSGSGPSRRTVRLGAVAAGAVALVLCVRPAAIRADFREAARKLVPATVVITRVEHAAFRSSTKPPAGATAGGGAAKADGGKAFLSWTVTPSSAQNAAVAAVNVWCGVLIRSDGWIVTTSGGPANAELEVRLTQGPAFPARVVVDDRRTGLWLLKASLAEAPAIALATAPVELGQDVVAAIMDGPKSRQIARGIVTALNRHVDEIPLPLILTDLPVPEAAAGAPVSNTQGELVGLVSAHGQGNDKHARVITATLVNELFMSRRDGAVTTIEPGMLGISLRDAGDGKSMAVIGVSGGSPAAKAGLQEGDQVQSIDDRQFKSPEELMEYVGMKSPGLAVLVKYRRGDKDLVAAAVLAARPILAQPASPNNVMVTLDVPTFFVTNGNGVNTNLGIQFLGETAQAPPQTPVVRVEKTDVEKRIDELRHDVGALTRGIDSIRSHLDKLGADLKALSESRNKN